MTQQEAMAENINASAGSKWNIESEWIENVQFISNRIYVCQKTFYLEVPGSVFNQILDTAILAGSKVI